MLTNEKALEILKQPDRVGCNLIKANDEESCKYNQESIEAFNMLGLSLEKLGKIEQIMKKYQNILNNFYEGKPRDLLESDVLRDIKRVIENEDC